MTSRDERRLSVHHIGGRSGSRAFPILRSFERDLINVLYDADPDCLEQVEERNSQLGSELHVLPYCIGGRIGRAPFNINFDPYTSSLIDPNPDYSDFSYFYKDHDYIFGQATRRMERRELEVTTLDDLFARPDDPVPPPDFLSIDTQGSEFEVLAGATETLRGHVLGAIVEVELHPLYADQVLFGDITRRLASLGFRFVKFMGLLELAPYRVPIGLRGEGIQVSADALFLRDPRTLGREIANERTRWNMLRKLAFISIAYSQFGHGVESLRLARELVGVPRNGSRIVFQAFLDEFEAAVDRLPRLFPPTLSEKYTFEASRDRFAPTRVGTARTDRVRRVLRRVPLVWGSLRRARRVIVRLVSLLGAIQRRATLSLGGVTQTTEVERLLRRYGLVDQAAALQRNRLAQSPVARLVRRIEVP